MAEGPSLPPGLVLVRMSRRLSLLLTGAEYQRGRKRAEAWFQETAAQAQRDAPDPPAAGRPHADA